MQQGGTHLRCPPLTPTTVPLSATATGPPSPLTVSLSVFHLLVSRPLTHRRIASSSRPPQANALLQAPLPLEYKEQSLVAFFAIGNLLAANIQSLEPCIPVALRTQDWYEFVNSNPSDFLLETPGICILPKQQNRMYVVAERFDSTLREYGDRMMDNDFYLRPEFVTIILDDIKHTMNHVVLATPEGRNFFRTIAWTEGDRLHVNRNIAAGVGRELSYHRSNQSNYWKHLVGNHDMQNLRDYSKANNRHDGFMDMSQHYLIHAHNKTVNLVYISNKRMPKLYTSPYADTSLPIPYSAR
ncbi:hypothetical protein LguiB_005762 [Lonicera macranthoides]